MRDKQRMIHGMCLGRYGMRLYSFGWAMHRGKKPKDIPRWLERLKQAED